MRHIPEDELHAYLDQALSRSQCVEIEIHLAGCAGCQSARDGIAALRDRTTALLTRLAPSRALPPSYDIIRRRAALQVAERRRRLHLAAWAASVVAAVGLGWTANYWMSSPSPAPVPTSAQQFVPRPAVPVTPTAAPATAGPAPALAAAESAPARSARRASRAARRTEARTTAARGAEAQRPASLQARPAPDSGEPAPAPVLPPPALELSSVDIPETGFELELEGMWRTLSWDGARAEAGDKLPHIDGLPVVQVQLQASEQGKQPLMVVAQQLASGEVIRTIEGPTSDVSHLLARRTMTDPDPAKRPSDSTRASRNAPNQVGGTMAMQRGDRMLVITGALPPDSLLAMIRRLNAEMRSK